MPEPQRSEEQLFDLSDDDDDNEPDMNMRLQQYAQLIDDDDDFSSDEFDSDCDAVTQRTQIAFCKFASNHFVKIVRFQNAENCDDSVVVVEPFVSLHTGKRKRSADASYTNDEAQALTMCDCSHSDGSKRMRLNSTCTGMDVNNNIFQPSGLNAMVNNIILSFLHIKSDKCNNRIPIFIAG